MAREWQEIDWRCAPLDDVYRTLAGRARDDQAFYLPENHAQARQVEDYLTRYSRSASFERTGV